MAEIRPGNSVVTALACAPGCECWKELPLGSPERRDSYQWHYRHNPANRKGQKARRDRYHERHPDAMRTAFLKHKHGMTQQDWAVMRAAQDGLCYLCERALGDDSTVHIDHDHACCPPSKSCVRCRRGLAHRDCNRLIGIAGEDADLLNLMAANLLVATLRVRRAIPPAAEAWS